MSKTIAAKLAVCAVLAILIIIWIRSRVAVIAGTSIGWGVYGKAIGIILLAIFVIWLCRVVIRRRRVRRLASSANARSNQPAAPQKAPKLGTFAKLLLWFAVLSFVAAFAATWTINRWRPQANQQAVATTQPVLPSPLTTPVPPPTPSFVPTGYEERFCGTEEESKAGNFANLELADFQIDFGPGCFAGPFVLPKTGWTIYNVDKSRDDGDWAAIWCEGRPHPNPVRPFYQDFEVSDLKGCTAFYTQGKGSAHFKSLAKRSSR